MYRFTVVAVCVLGLISSAITAAFAQQTVFHIGLREDPDLLDPILGSSYVGRIVFAGLCDKLFDITPDLKIIPQLATGFRGQRSYPSANPVASGRAIPGR